MAVRWLRVLSIPVLAILLSACQGKEKGKTATPLSPEQIDQVESLTRSMDQVKGAIDRAKDSPSILSTSKKSETLRPKPRVGSARKMAEKISKQVCTYRSSPPRRDDKAAGETFMKVSGSDCPIFYETRNKFVSTRLELSTYHFVEYEVLDSSFRNMNDVDKVEVEGTVGTRGSVRGADFFGKVTGRAHSQSLGTVKISLENSGSIARDGGSQFQALTLEYLDTVVVGRVEIIYNTNGDKVGLNFWINGVPHQEKDFSDIMGTQFFDY